MYILKRKTNETIVVRHPAAAAPMEITIGRIAVSDEGLPTKVELRFDDPTKSYTIRRKEADDAAEPVPSSTR